MDLLLLSLPWTKRALERSSANKIKFGELPPLPCLTVEDSIISKLYAIKSNSDRVYKKSDVSDIVLIFENNSNLDISYLSDVMTEFELVLPKILEEKNYLLARISRKNRKKTKVLAF